MAARRPKTAPTKNRHPKTGGTSVDMLHKTKKKQKGQWQPWPSEVMEFKKWKLNIKIKGFKAYVLVIKSDPIVDKPVLSH